MDFFQNSKIKAKIIKKFVDTMLDNCLNNVIKKTQLFTFKIDKAFRLSKLYFFKNEI